MHRRLWFIACPLVLTLGLVGFSYWPASAQNRDEIKPTDPLAAMEKRLERMEKTLKDIQEHLNGLQVQKTGWQKLNEPNDKGDYYIMMEMTTGKVTTINKSSGQTFNRN